MYYHIKGFKVALFIYSSTILSGYKTFKKMLLKQFDHTITISDPTL